jgi:hypothetical protein
MQAGKLINGIGLLVIGGGLIYYGRSVNGKWWIIWGVFLLLSGLTSVSMSFSRAEGDLCTPPANAPVVPLNGKPYVYDKDGKCSFQGCVDGYTLLKDGTCIKIGDLCTPPADAPVVPLNGKPYVYDTDGKCSFQGCVDGYTLLKDGTCFKEGSACTTAAPVENSSAFKYSAAGECLLDSCITGYTPKSGVCTQDNIETVADPVVAFTGNLNSLVTQSDAAYAAFIEKKNAYIAATPEVRATLQISVTLGTVTVLYLKRYILETRVPAVDPAAEVTITESEISAAQKKIISVITDVGGSSSTEVYPDYINRFISDYRELLPPRPP